MEDRHTIFISIAGEIVEFLTPDLSLYDQLRSYFSNYLAEKNEAKFRIYACGLNPSTLEQDSIGPHVEQNDFIALDRGVVTGKRTVHVWLKALDLKNALAALRYFFPRVLLDGRALVLSGASLIYDSQGYVFLGGQGVGKSTFVALVSGNEPTVKTISDRAVLVKLDSANSAKLYSFPFERSYSRLPHARIECGLSKIFALKQTSKPFLKPLNQAQSIEILLNHIEDFYGFERRGLKEFEVSTQVIRTIGKIYDLGFEKDTRSWGKLKDEIVATT